MAIILILIYMAAGYWATGKTIFFNPVLIGNLGDIFIKRCVMGAVLGWILIPVALILRR